MSLLESNKRELDGLRCYYNKTFTNNWDQIFTLRNHCSGQKSQALSENIICRLGGIAEYILKNLPCEDSLYEGRMGAVIWLCHYADFSHEARWDNTASELMTEITDDITLGKLPVNFRYGLCGIGWGMIYLYFHHLLENIPAEVLDIIDRAVMTINFENVSDYSFDTGMGGVLAYASVRLMYRHPCIWDDKIFSDLEAVATKIYGDQNDTKSLYFALVYLDRYKSSSDRIDLRPSLEELLDETIFLPKDEKYWTFSLIDGCLGSSLSVMLKRKEDEKEKIG